MIEVYFAEWENIIHNFPNIPSLIILPRKDIIQIKVL